MRKKNEIQMPLIPSGLEHTRARELDQISDIPDAIPTITDMVLQDLTHGVVHRHCGADGMSAEQALRAATVFQKK